MTVESTVMTSEYLRHGIPSRARLIPVLSLSTTAELRYSADELLSLRRDDLPLPRPVRKVICRYRLWRPSLQRHQQSFPGNSVRCKYHVGNPGQSADRLSRSTIDCIQRIPVIIGRRQQQQQSGGEQNEVRSLSLREIEVFEQFVPTFFTANIRGGFMRKVDELQTVLEQNSIDIGCITETWLHTDVPSEVVDVRGYVLHHTDRSDGRRGGGVAVLVRQELPCQRLTPLETTNMEVVWLLYRRTRMPRQLSHVAVGAIYHPPNADDRTMVDYLVRCLHTITCDHPNAGIVLLGDFNRMRDISLLSYPLKQPSIKSTQTLVTGMNDLIYYPRSEDQTMTLSS